MKTETQTDVPSDLAENLDGFADSADLLQHIDKMILRNLTLDLSTVSPSDVAPDAYLEYGRFKARAMDFRLAGNIVAAMQNERTADILYRRIPSAWRW